MLGTNPWRWQAQVSSESEHSSLAGLGGLDKGEARNVCGISTEEGTAEECDLCSSFCVPQPPAQSARVPRTC